MRKKGVLSGFLAASMLAVAVPGGVAIADEVVDVGAAGDTLGDATLVTLTPSGEVEVQVTPGESPQAEAPIAQPVGEQQPTDLWGMIMQALNDLTSLSSGIA